MAAVRLMDFMYVFQQLVPECWLLTPELEALSLPPRWKSGQALSIWLISYCSTLFDSILNLVYQDLETEP